MNDNNDEVLTGELVQNDSMGAAALEAVERASVDIQIATAHRFPRSIDRFNKTAKAMITQDKETAESCIYSRPVGKKDGVQQYAEGKSVRMAEIVGACYGNLRVGAMVIEQTPQFVRCRGVAHDLESNFLSTSEVVESTLKRDGSPFDPRMRIVVLKAALAKARRDAIFQVVPGALCKSIETEAYKVIRGGLSFEQRVANAFVWASEIGIGKDRVLMAFGIKGEKDMTEEHLITLAGLKTAIKNKDVTPDEAFPRESVKMPTAKDGNGKGKTASQQANGAPEATGQAQEQEKGKEGEINPAAMELRNLMAAAGVDETTLIWFLAYVEKYIPEDGTLADLDADKATVLSEVPKQTAKRIKAAVKEPPKDAPVPPLPV